jgi:capsular exopolysaccharide synthesis family protein
MAFVLGLLVAVADVLILEALRERAKSADDYPVKSADDMTKLGLMSLAVVPLFPGYGSRNGSKADSVTAAWSKDSSLAEIYRFLRTNVEFATIAHGGQVLLVTSANPLEGKSTTATNLAVAMAKAGRRTLLVDADLRSPTLHLQFGVTNNTGLTTLLSADDVDFRQVLCPTAVTGLTLIPSGPLPQNVADLLASGRLRRFVKCAKEGWDVVILDSPPMNRVADASLLAREADVTVLVVEADKTRAKAVTACLESLRRAHSADAPSNGDVLLGTWRTTPPTPVRAVGAVLNKMTRRDGQFPPYGVES